MKVTVCFDSMRVIVPCGDGELRVSELINRAVNRYKKASQKDTDAVIHVHCLKTVEENAILDIDDSVTDVCDDKDILIAVYDEGERKTSPDLVNNNLSSPINEDSNQYNTSTLSDNDSGVAADAFGMSSNPPSTHTSLTSSSRPPRGIKKFIANKNSSFRSSVSSNSPTSSPELSRHALKAPGPFTRDANRKSLSTNHPMLYSWIDQQDKYNSSSYYADGNEADGNDSEKSFGNEEITLDQQQMKSIEIKPYSNAENQEIGLVVHSVVEDSYMDRVGELQMADLIIEINGLSLKQLTNSQALEVYETATKSDIIRLKRTRSHNFLKEQITLPVLDKLPKLELPKPELPKPELPKPEVLEELLKTKEAPKLITSQVYKHEQHESAIEAPETDSKEKTMIVGNKDIFYINLIKGNHGLGFTVASKDVITSLTTDFFIKSILNKGAAIKDGRIKAGDQLLSINQNQLHNKSQSEVVKILRAAQGMVVLQLARTKSTEGQEAMPAEEKNISSGEDSLSSTGPSPQNPDEVLKLTIPLSSQGSAGLGISVKGKRGDSSNTVEEDQGIYVKSVIKGGAAAKDGRIKINDQLLCINDTSLIGLSNTEAMNVLRASMEQSLVKGSILIIVGRSSKVVVTGMTSPMKHGSPARGNSPKARRESPKILNRRSLIGTDYENLKFNDTYLSKTPPTNHNIIRNKSYFKAVSPRIRSESEHDSENSTPRTVSISSVELPEVQKLHLENTISKPPESPNFKNKFIPSYEEALQRKHSNASSHSGKTSSSKGSKHDQTENIEHSKFKILPDKMPKFPPRDYDQPKLRNTSTVSLRDTNRLHSHSHNDLQNLEEMSRCASVASQSSLDSIFVGPNQIPFSRDAFGRSSMSERKGRAHIDATKSDFYMKLKKYKSMEELRAHSLDQDDTLIGEQGMGQRTESVDTIISRMDEEEQNQANAFYRGTIYSASTPWYTHASDDTKAGRKGTRGSLLNESFKKALDQKTKNEIRNSLLKQDDKKKKGFLKGISTLLRRKKNARGEDQVSNRSESPEYQDEEYRSNNLNGRPLSLSAELYSKDASELSSRFFQADVLQKELVEQKKQQIEQQRKVHKKRKSESGLNNIIHQDEESFPQPKTWSVYEASNVRERSKQFFDTTRDSMRSSNPRDSMRSNQSKDSMFSDNQLNNSMRKNNQPKDIMRSYNSQSKDITRSSTRSSELRRQSSLPPRNKKDNVEFHRILPKTPSGENFHKVSPELNYKKNNNRGTSSAPNSKPATPNKKTTMRSPFDSLQRKNRKEKKEQKEQQQREQKDPVKYSSISDLTRNESVSISMQAQI